MYQVSAVWCQAAVSLTRCLLHSPTGTAREHITHDSCIQLPAEVASSAKALSWENWQLGSEINSNLRICFLQTVILISENHKFIHLPFSLEVKCKGFRTEQASSVTCQRAAEQKHTGIVSNTDIYIYIY